MILLTFDDLIDSNRFNLVQQVLTNRRNPNGSPIQATFFVNTDWSDYWLIQRLHAAGHEIAAHTMTHTTGISTDLPTWRAEIAGCRKAISDLCGIPRSELVGFRAPYLQYDNESFEVLHEQGFAYDASIIEAPGALSRDGTSFIWPYTLDQGVPQHCWTGTRPTNNFPGLFEVPIWDLLNTNGESYASMNPEGTYAELTTVFRHNFTNRYNGNRAPMGLFLHPDWLTNTMNRAALNDFVSWVQGYSDVWLVSVRALTAFMRNPQSSTAAYGFAPFITITNALPPELSLNRCMYSLGEFRTTNESPIAWPAPDTLYRIAAPMPGGTWSIAITALYSTSYDAVLVVTNTTPRDAIDWDATFRVQGGTVTWISDGIYETNGIMVSIHPDYWIRPLSSGAVHTVGFGGGRSGPVSFTSGTLVLYGLDPRRPEIMNVGVASNRAFTMYWDDSAFGYRVESTPSLNPTNWAPLSEVHGTTGWTSGIPGRSGLFRLITTP